MLCRNSILPGSGIWFTILHNYTDLTVPVHVVSARLGHSSIRVTLDFYSHIVPGIQDQVAELLDQMIDDSDPDANAEEE